MAGGVVYPPDYVRARLLLVLFLALPLLLAAHENDWRDVAESHIRFARKLAAGGTRFDAAARERVVGERLRGDCAPFPSKIRDLTVSERDLLKNYILEVCAPRVEAWGEVFGECADRIVTPRWCKSGNDGVIAEHVGLQAYFETLVKGFDAASPLERANIMGVFADFLRDESLRHYPDALRDKGVAQVAAAFLRVSTADEGFLAAEPILRASFGSGQPTIAAFREFRDREPSLSPIQKCALDAMLRHGDPETCPGYEPQVHRKTQAEIDQEQQVVQAVAMRADNLRRLKERIDAFYGLQRDANWNASYDFMAVHLREGGYDREDWVRTSKYVSKDFPLIAWEVQPRILVLGNAAEVRVRKTHRYLEGKMKGQESVRELEEYWYFENGTWDYGFSVAPDDWEGRRATANMLVEVQP